jgi:hypothetical protein
MATTTMMQFRWMIDDEVLLQEAEENMVDPDTKTILSGQERERLRSLWGLLCL